MFPCRWSSPPSLFIVGQTSHALCLYFIYFIFNKIYSFFLNYYIVYHCFIWLPSRILEFFKEIKLEMEKYNMCKINIEERTCIDWYIRIMMMVRTYEGIFFRLVSSLDHRRASLDTQDSLLEPRKPHHHQHWIPLMTPIKFHPLD